MSQRDPDDTRPTARGDIKGYLAGFETRMSRLQEQADDSRERLEAISASAASDHEEVTVTVGAGGALLAVEYGPNARRTSPQSLGEMTMAMYAKAVADAASQATAVMTGLLGADSPAMSNFEASLRRGEHSAGGEY